MRPEAGDPTAADSQGQGAQAVGDEPVAGNGETPDPEAARVGHSQQSSSDLAGCGPEFLLLEIEIMRLEGVVAQDTDPAQDQTAGP